MDTAKLFQNGRSQAVRLPKAYRFRGKKVYLKRQGVIVLLIPEGNPWDSLIESLDGFTDDYMARREQPPEQHRRSAFR
jgi:antitoxin VapB